MFEVLLGLDLSHQPSAGLRAIKKRPPEKAGSILRASRKFHGLTWFRLSAVAVLAQFSMWNGPTPNPYLKFRPLTLSQLYHSKVNTTKYTELILEKPVHEN